MCGIAGYIGINQEGLIDRMLQTIRHRGPDSSNCWVDQSIPMAIGHVRLSILDLSDRGNQPMWDDTGRFCITYNGEIYNYRELRSELEGRGCNFRSNTDTEVILNLFRDKGHACLTYLKGIWAFAIWDASDRKLFLSRDPLGVKPLYYISRGKQFLFSSEIKSFLNWSDFSKHIDNAAMLETLTYLWTPGPRTMFSQVRKMMPGQNLTVYPGRPNITVSTTEVSQQGSLDHMNEDVIADLLREQLYQSIQSQLVSDVPVGAFLSGGLDSSSIVAMAERNGPRISRCYTINYAGGRTWEGMVNDLSYARLVASHLGVECVEIPLDESIYERVNEMIWHLDEPQADIAPLNVLLIAEAARKNGDYVLLSGAGGDDIFSGYRRHTALQNEYLWDWLPYPFRNGLRMCSKIFPTAYPFGRRLQKLFEYADLPADERLPRYFAWFPDKLVRSVLTEDILRELECHDSFDVMRTALSSHNFSGDQLNKMLFLDMKYFLADHNLNYTDKMGMARGVEIRVPLIDIDLVSLALRIPASLKLKKMTGKYIFKRSMEPYLPKDIIYRPKTGFVAPIREWVSGPLLYRIKEVLSAESLKKRGWFSPRGVQNLFNNLRANKNDIHYLVWSLYTIEEWARIFIDGEGINQRQH
ncbi:MAG: asparagine synthase (glutamine-hydrolyzing) [Nitrospiraceae bacterium]|nr:MAG: asparagine synthase (glutamine-hydrolyzing) [Nitrospiraceae bacterium]